MQFTTAKKHKLKARVALDGPSGAGKTYTSLVAATVLAGKTGRIAVIDTERGSARLYADKFNFDVLELPSDHRGFNPAVYTEAIHAAEEAGYDVIVIDSLSHAWEGAGGALDLVDQAASKIKGNSYAAWRSVTPLHNKLVDAMLQSPAHIVATMRSKMEYLQEENNGKKTIKKVGMAPIQRAGMEYEYTVVIDMEIGNKAVVSKTRCDILEGMVVDKPDTKFFQLFADWLDDGDDAPPPERKPEVVVNAVPGTTASASDYNKTWANLLKVSKQKHGIDEAQVKEVLKANNFKAFTPEVYIAALTAVDMAFAKPVEDEPLPAYLQD